MRKEITIILAMMMIIPLISLASALTSVGPFQQGEDITLPQIADNSTFCNLTSIQYPNSTKISINDNMALFNGEYAYTLNSNYTQNKGTNIACTTCDPNGVTKIRCFTYLITQTGTEPSITQGIIYFAVLLLSVVLFVIALYGAIQLPMSNDRDDEGNIFSINYKKYGKMILIFSSYLLLLWISWTAWNINEAFFNVDVGTSFFRSIFYFLMGALIPVLIVFVILIIAAAVNDLKLEKLLDRGLRPR